MELQRQYQPHPNSQENYRARLPPEEDYNHQNQGDRSKYEYRPPQYREIDRDLAPKISPVKNDFNLVQPPRSQSNHMGTGLPIGRSDLDEKALRRQRQAEYKKQLDAQNQMRLQNKCDDEVIPDLRFQEDVSKAPRVSRQTDTNRNETQQSNFESRSRNDHLREIDDVPQANAHRSHIKGVAGKVNMESQDVDKYQRRKQQEEYRRQLDIQAKADQDRKEKAKQEEGDEIISDNQTDNASIESHPHPSRNEMNMEPFHGRESNIPQQQRSAPPAEANSPGRSPTKARNRLLTDVYGGFSLGGGTEDAIGKISMRGMDVNDTKKKAAIREQQRALEQQIEEKRKLKEAEEKKIRLEEEKIAKYEAEKERERNIQNKQSWQQQQQQQPEHENDQENNRSALEKAAHQIAKEKLKHQKNLRAQEETLEDNVEYESPHHSSGITSSPRPSTPNKVPRPPPPTNPLENDSSFDRENDRELKTKPSQFSQNSRRVATPGGSLEQESQIIPIPDSEIERESYREETYRSYRHNVDEEDRVVVDWQRHRGYSTKRGTTPKSEDHSKKKRVPADPWAPGGLLSLLTGKTPPREKRERKEETSLLEKSLVSDSMLMYLDVPPPSRGGQKKTTQVPSYLAYPLIIF